MLRRNAVTIGVVLAVLATVALSQEPRGRARGPGGFMFAGPGGQQGSAVMLVGMPEVQQELAVSDEQRKRVDELMGNLQEQMRTSIGNIDFQELANLSEEERMQRFEESRYLCSYRMGFVFVRRGVSKVNAWLPDRARSGCRKSASSRVR